MPESEKAKRERTIRIINKLRIATRRMEKPAATQIVAEFGRDPFLVLVGCILSLRTTDTVSLPASRTI
jgi:endonuclease III